MTKSFFAYARCKAKTKIRVGAVIGPDGKEIKDLTQVAEKFNDQFSSVFSAENVTDIPVPTNIFTRSDGDKPCDIIFIEEEVPKRLLCLWQDKSAASAIAERPRDARVTSIRKNFEVEFLRHPFAGLKGNVDASCARRWKKKRGQQCFFSQVFYFSFRLVD